MKRHDQPRRILVVEVHVEARRGYAEYLTRRGYAVSEAGTGRDALALAATAQPDVIVLDLGLPDIDGWEVARQLKADRATATVPIIALTGAGLPHERASAMRAGCERHLAKPCAPQDLIDAIERCLDPAPSP